MLQLSYALAAALAGNFFNLGLFLMGGPAVKTLVLISWALAFVSANAALLMEANELPDLMALAAVAASTAAALTLIYGAFT